MPKSINQEICQTRFSKEDPSPCCRVWTVAPLPDLCLLVAFRPHLLPSPLSLYLEKLIRKPGHFLPWCPRESSASKPCPGPTPTTKVLTLALQAFVRSEWEICPEPQECIYENPVQHQCKHTHIYMLIFTFNVGERYTTQCRCSKGKIGWLY